MTAFYIFLFLYFHRLAKAVGARSPSALLLSSYKKVIRPTKDNAFAALTYEY